MQNDVTDYPVCVNYYRISDKRYYTYNKTNREKLMYLENSLSLTNAVSSVAE